MKKATKKAPRRTRVKHKFELPKVTKLKPREVLKNDAVALNKVSYSTLAKFCTQPILFRVNYLNLDRIESTTGVSAIMGRAFHNGLEVFYGGSDDYIISNLAEAIQYGLEAAIKYLEEYNDGFIKYSKTVDSKAKAIEKVAYAFNSYVNDSQTVWVPEQVLFTEEKLEHDIRVQWNGETVDLPITLNGRIDRVEKRGDEVIIFDPKMVYSFSDPDKIDAQKMIQTVQYYLLVHAETGVEPTKVVFEETKYTKNKDGSPQVRRYEFVIKDNPLFFDFYFRLYEDLGKALLGEMVYVPNFNDLYEADLAVIAYIHRLDQPDEVAKQMKRHKVDNISDLLKRKIAKAGYQKKLMAKLEAQFEQVKSIDYKNMQPQERIKMKLLEHGMSVHYHSVVEGNTYDLYQYEPSVGVKMAKLHGYVADIEQVLGVEGVRVLAPVPNTSFIGFEVPRAERVYPNLPARNAGKMQLLVGEDGQGNKVSFDLRKAPHVLIGGGTGSGKSVALTSFIQQLHKHLKKEVQTVLFDPKMVELGRFANDKNCIGYHTDPTETVTALKRLVETMEMRYTKLTAAGVRQNSELAEPMPYIVAVIDEYADLANSTNKVQTGTKTVTKIYKKGAVETAVPEYEKAGVVIAELVQRLAAKSRAAGIHLIVTTQRPSVKIISGDIKANLTTQLAFKTAKEIDSRIILDEAGAERLQGDGDALFNNGKGVIGLQAYYAS